MSAFAYHTQALRLLGAEPVASPAAVRELEAWEARHSLRIPASVREWYSHADSDTLLTSALGGFLPRAEVLQNVAEAARYYEPRLALFYCWRTGWDSEVCVPIDGPDDPTTVARHPKGYHKPAPFGVVVSDHAWKRVAYNPLSQRVFVGGSPVTASPLRIGPPHLDWLMENFELLPKRPGTDANWHTFCFFGPAGRIELNCVGDPATGERPAHATLLADDASRAAALFLAAWPFHPGPVSLLGVSDPADRQLVRDRTRLAVPGVQFL